LLALLQFGGHTALEAVRHNRLRAGLTSLGILFGVAAVIAMQAIGQGAQQEILQQMVLLGSNNVIITPVVAKSDERASAAPGPKEARKFSPGLTYEDAQSIARVVPAAELVGSEVVLGTTFTRQQQTRPGKVVGVDSAYFRLTNLELEQGNWFTPGEMDQGLPVAIIGSGVRVRFFTAESPIGKQIKVGDTWFTVVGVLADRRVDADAATRLGVRNANQDVYVPIRAMLLRLRDRARVTARSLGGGGSSVTIVNGSVVGGSSDGGGGGSGGSTPSERAAERANYNQLDRIIVRVADANKVTPAVDLVHRMLSRRHNGVADFEVSVPELLLRQQQRTKTIFNIVLGAIASISLVVGGIGIMNIMLASVLERIREIGVRRALGATRTEILLQFLSEAVLISVAGGVAGILLGVTLSVGIARFAGIKTLVSLSSVAVAFGVSVAVGIAFGVVPARRASEQDPIHCLRYE